MSPIFELSLTLITIYFFFWAIRPINFAKFMPYTPVQATFLKVMLAIIGGYLLSASLSQSHNGSYKFRMQF